MTLRALDPRELAVATLVAQALAVVVLAGVRSLIRLRREGDVGWRSSRTRAELLGSGLALAAIAGLVGGPLGVAVLGWQPLWRPPLAWQLACGVLYGASLLGCFDVQLQMGRAWRIGVRADEATELVSEGAFARVRNPIFSLVILLYAALVAALPHPVTLAGLLLVVLAIRVQVVHVEEPHLRAQLGAPYEAYLARTPRFVPRLR